MKKTIVIIAILAVVGFCLYWFVFRKTDESNGASGSGKNSNPEAGNGTGSNSGVLVDKTSTDSIVDSLGLPRNVAGKVKAYALNAMKNIETRSDWGKNLIEAASNNGVNSVQESVLAALWIAYETDKLIVLSEYSAAAEKVKAL